MGVKSDELLEELSDTIDSYISRYEELKETTRNRRERPQCINIISELERAKANLEKFKVMEEV